MDTKTLYIQGRAFDLLQSRLLHHVPFFICAASAGSTSQSLFSESPITGPLHLDQLFSHHEGF
jgi:hypothetical protein